MIQVLIILLELCINMQAIALPPAIALCGNEQATWAVIRFEQSEPSWQAPPEEEKQPDWINHIQDLVARAKPGERAVCAPAEKAPAQAAKEQPIDVPEFKGAYYLIGGNAGSALKELFKDKDKADKVVCVPLASDLPNAAELDAKDLIAAGVPAQNIRFIYKRGGKPPISKFPCSEDIPSDATVVYFSGGDQERLRKRFDDKQLDAIKKLVSNGATVVGNSAGTAVMSEEMIAGGDSAHLRHAQGFGLVPWAIMDTHVGERGRETRDVTALYDIGKGLRPVVGLDPGTAVQFSWEEGKLIGKVTGAGTAHVFLPTGAKLETGRSLMPKIVQTDNGTHRQADMWELRAGDTFVVPNVQRSSK